MVQPSSPYTISFQGTDLHIVKNKRLKRSMKLVFEDRYILFVPHTLSKRSVEQGLKLKTRWLEKTIRHFESQPKEFTAPKNIVEGDMFHYLGQAYPLHVVETNQISFGDSAENSGGDSVLFFPQKYANKPQVFRRKKLVEWYRKMGFIILDDRMHLFEKKMNLYARTMQVRTYKSRWGCCLKNGDIRFHWGLVCLPLEVLDYVVVHELAHLEEFNHSKKFWALVERFCPNYKAIKQSLKSYPMSLFF